MTTTIDLSSDKRERLTTEQFFYERKETDRLEHDGITRDIIYKYIKRKR